MAAAAPPAPPDYLPAGVSKNEAIAYVDKSVSSDLVHIFNECAVSIGLQYSFGAALCYCQEVQHLRGLAGGGPPSIAQRLGAGDY